MAWVEKRGRWRLRDVLNGEKVTVVKDLGIWKQAAEDARDDYKRAKVAGFIPDLGSPNVMADVRSFLAARAEGRENASVGLPVPMEQLCDLYHMKHGPSLKGGVNMQWNSPYMILRGRMNVIKRTWAGRMSDSINKLDVRDFLAQFVTLGNKIKYLNTISHIFKSIEEWNEEGILRPAIRIPPHNPATKWRAKMKPVEKKEIPHNRVLSPEEWHHFRQFLKPRTRAICEITLRRFLRVADVKKISQLAIKNMMIIGVQEKTGEQFSVPVLDNQPQKYDFTNFRREFHKAQVLAHMDYPPGHPRHFTIKDFRRTGATWAYQKTKDLVGISKMLGHTKISTTIRYLNIDETDKLKVAKAVDRIASGGAPVGRRSIKSDKYTHLRHTVDTLEPD